MGIFGFLLGLGCLVLIAWAISLIFGAVFSRKCQQQNRQQPLPKPTEARERNSSQPYCCINSSTP